MAGLNLNTYTGPGSTTSKGTGDKDSDTSGKSTAYGDPGGADLLRRIYSKGKNIIRDLGPSKGFDKDSPYTGDPGTEVAAPPSAKKGSKVKHTGKMLVHKGERVLNRKQTRKYEARKRA